MIIRDQYLLMLEESNVGYFVEMDLKYHQQLDDTHNGLPLSLKKLCKSPYGLMVSFARKNGWIEIQ